MPFTLAHPAIFLPFRRLHSQYLSWSALITGAMTPDFEGILMLNPKKEYGHTWAGMFYLDLPLGLLLLWVFHRYVKYTLLQYLPDALSGKLAGFTVTHTKKGMAMVLSLLIGISTHLLWDSVTHRNDYLPALQEIHQAGPFRMEGYLWLQYASSVLGVAAIIQMIHALPQTQAPRFRPPKAPYWFRVLGTGLAAALLISLCTPGGISIKSIMVGLLAGLVLTSAYYTTYITKHIKYTGNGKT